MNPLLSVLVGLLIIGVSVVVFLFIIDMIIEKKKTIYDKEYRTSMQKAADAEDPNLFNIDWSDFGPNKEEWEE